VQTALIPLRNRITSSSNWIVEDFVRDHLPDLHSVTVLLGTPGPAPKTTIQCWNTRDQVIGYLKYATTKVARSRVSHEYTILRSLPGGIGPVPLKHGSFGLGEALLITPVTGDPVSASLPPNPGLYAFTQSLYSNHPLLPIHDHPWTEHHILPEKLETACERLAGRVWPVVIQHGDLAPWNLRKDPGGGIAAFDWEYGALQSLPLIDEVQYLLQVSALIYRWPPGRGKNVALDYLIHHPALKLSEPEAEAMVRLAAFDAFARLQEDGHPPDTYLQSWKRTIWED